MQKRRLTLLTLVTAFILSGCDFSFSSIFNKKTNEDEKTDTPVDPPEHGRFYGGPVAGALYSGYEFSVSPKNIKRPTEGVADINIYGFNDFHGAVKEIDDNPGLKQVGSFFKAVSREKDTLVFDQGDTWQGSYESNSWNGLIVREVLDDAWMSLRTVGNHDFDWGVETLRLNTQATYTPTLAANVYNLNGTERRDNLGKDYATFVLDSGVKVGVVGVIGESEITSICSTLVSDISFTNHNEKIKEISDFLRNEKECDVVIASAHEMASNMLDSGLTDISPLSGKRYVDLVLNGHAHSKNVKTENGVQFVQWDSDGRSVGGVHLHYNFKTGRVLDNDTKIDTFYKRYLNVYYPIDQQISDHVDSYLDAISEKGNQVLSTKFEGSFTEQGIANLMAEAIYNKVTSLGYDIACAVTNSARFPYQGSTMTFSDMYRCFPFDNQIILCKSLHGSTPSSSIMMNCSYIKEGASTSSYDTYDAAVIDYLAYHQNANRENNYFGNGEKIPLVKEDGSPLMYRDALVDFLLANPDKTFSASDYN